MPPQLQTRPAASARPLLRRLRPEEDSLVVVEEERRVGLVSQQEEGLDSLQRAREGLEEHKPEGR